MNELLGPGRRNDAPMPTGTVVRFAADLKLLSTVAALEARAENVRVRLGKELLDRRLLHAEASDDSSLLQHSTCHLTFQDP